jgi:uncharacterized protein YaeQ
MALKSTVFKATLTLSDLDRGYYAEHALTLALHPSETEERMMIRLLAFAMYADERLEFGRGLSAEDEPALWLKDYTGAITLWIETGLPDERALRRAAGRAEQVVVLAYGGRAAEIWWEKQGAGIRKIANAKVLNVPVDQAAALTALAERSMQIQCTVQDGQLWFSAGDESVLVEPIVLK